MAWRTEQLLPNSPRAHCDIPLLSFTQHTLNQSGAWLTHTPKAVQRMKREEVISFWIRQIFHCLAMDVGISPCFCNLSFSGALSRLHYGTDLPSSGLTNHGRVVCQSPQMANEQLAKKTLHQIQDNAQNIMENLMLSAVPGSAHIWQHHYTATYVPCSAPKQRAAASKLPSRLYIKHPLQKWSNRSHYL